MEKIRVEQPTFLRGLWFAHGFSRSAFCTSIFGEASLRLCFGLGVHFSFLRANRVTRNNHVAGPQLFISCTVA